jgi:mannose-6-phosphate isomerase-like protein (cupin superfamily)
MASAPEVIELLGHRVSFLHLDPQSRVSLLEWHAPAGTGGIPIHVHEHTEEGFYVLHGQLSLWVDDEELVRGPGSYTVVHPGQRHTFWNPAEEPATYLTPISPGGFARYLWELANGLKQARTDDEADVLRRRLSERYDIAVVGPPPRG